MYAYDWPSVFGSSGGGDMTVQGVIGILASIVQGLIAFLIGFAVLLFLLGVLRYVAAGDNEEARKRGRDLIIYGIIGLAVMVSVWGLVNILTNTFGLEDSNSYAPDIPILPTP
jgi:hypothetical protein